MPDPGRPAASASLLTATACAFAIIITQVAGKATRDTLFLTNFDISSLPLILIASALLSIGAAVLTTRAMTLLGPLRVIPPLFLVSGVLLLAEWLLATRNVKLASVLIYLHIAVIGSILISGFWSIINEHFDPRTARRSIGRIAGSATAGGLLGGFLADRVGSNAGILSVLPIVAGLHMFCAFLLPRLKSIDPVVGRVSMRALLAGTEGQGATVLGLRVLRRTGYLRNLALIVLLGNLAATLIDFLFKARATEAFTSSADLMHFFAVFYTAVSLVTLAVQMGMTRKLLERIGIANTMAVRPAVMTLGGLITLPLTGLVGLGFLRGIEAVLQSSLFRSGYELLFMPVTPDQKRSTKSLIDVGADRMGDILGGGIIRAVILLPAAISGRLLVFLAVLVSVAGVVVARALRKGYVRALEERLIHRADALNLAPESPGIRTTMMESFAGFDLSVSFDGVALKDLRSQAGVSSQDESAQGTDAVGDTPSAPPAMHGASSDPEVRALMELRSGDSRRVHAALRQTNALSPVVAAQVISLLAWDDVTGWASRALAKAAPGITGQLLDRLLDPNEDFAIRRRIPRILSTCATPRAFDGLLAALHDRRFEVRYQSGRALARIRAQRPSIEVSDDGVYEAVLRETRVKKQLWEDQRILDDSPDGYIPAIIGEVVHQRANRSMEHVFTLLSVVLPSAPLQIAFKGLLTDDAVLRGTGLEYLESVLPRAIWDDLRPFLDDKWEGAQTSRPPEAVLDDLMRSSQSIDVNLEELRKRLKGS